MRIALTSTIASMVILTGLTTWLLVNGFSNSAQATTGTGAIAAAPNQDQNNDKLVPRKFAFIELFTSEGCSSCPSADENLKRIAASAAASGQEVYTLSYHVDYWNYLGWKDPYSDSLFSTRQRQYARQFKSSRVYTPQMVVNGKTEFVGSKRNESDQAVKVALSQAATGAITVNAVVQANVVTANWKAKGIKATDVVNVALVQNAGQQQVSRGENARRKLTHVNIVRRLMTVKNPGTGGAVKLDMPKGLAAADCHVVVFAQSGAVVTSAAKSKIVPTEVMPTKIAPTGIKLGMRGSTFTKVNFSTSNQSQTQSTKRKLVNEQKFLALLSRNPQQLANSIAAADANWDMSYVPMLLEVSRFLPETQRASVMHLVERKTGQKFGRDSDKWLQWSWKQKFDPHPGYANFKSILYQQMDSRFPEYFRDTENATVRLDEIRWGGVRRDGIPPLKNPKMLPANDAHYLADTDVVFGIELNGDARAYPKRILAWHEMFKDTIGGESVCGVY